MNLLIPPLVASVLVAGYIANASLERQAGPDRTFAADSMLRYHDAVMRAVAGTDPGSIPFTANVPAPELSPFIAVMDFRSVLARDTLNRVWTITYLDDATLAKSSTITDQAATSIPYELARRGYRNGTFGLWRNGSIESRSALITFDSGRAPPIPNGMPVIASLLQ